MEDKTNIQLTSAEMTGLWMQYMSDTVAICVNCYFLEKVEDEEVRPIIQFSLDTAKENVSIMEEIFHKEGFPVPVGFTVKDVNIDAPKLLSDTFMLMYLRHMSIIAMASTVSSLGVIARPDIVSFHKKVLNAALQLQDLTRDLMLKQGTYVRPPFISTPDEVDFINKQHFLAGFFGKKRSLTSIEVTNLFFNIQTNSIGKTLIMGFAQTAKNQKVKQFLMRGKDLAQNHIDTFADFIKKEDLPVPMNWDASVSHTTENIFSDKLMMFHILSMVGTGIGYYGTALAASPRRDVGLKYASLIPEISLFAEDGMNIMIKNQWMEEPPQADDREKLMKGK